MTCYSPLQAYYADGFTKKGKRKITFDVREAFNGVILYLPCGQCVGCRLERSRQWAIRCMHESKLHAQNCFITLTYAPEKLPKDGGLQLLDWQLFMKRFRTKFGNGIRFFHCGEYGDLNGRPHYHACIFGFDFDDRVYLKKLSSGFPIYSSKKLSDLWDKGYASVGDVSFESAAYVARYIMKKANGDLAVARYLDKETGALRRPEYVTMSRRPGIGKGWFDEFKGDVYPHDFLYLRGKKMRPPKYYDSLYEVIDPVDFERLKDERSFKAAANCEDNTLERLACKEVVKKITLHRLPRNLGSDDNVCSIKRKRKERL